MAKKLVLVVDDSDLVRAALSNTLRSIGCDGNFADGLEAARALLNEKTYDLIFSDNSMPEPDQGLALLSFVRNDPRHKDTPFILNTGDDSETAKQFALKMNAIYHSKYARDNIGDLILETLQIPPLS